MFALHIVGTWNAPDSFDLPELPTTWWLLNWEEIYYCKESRKLEAKSSRHLHFEESPMKMPSNEFEFLKIEVPTSSHSSPKQLSIFIFFSLNFCFLFFVRFYSFLSFADICSQSAHELSRVHAESKKTPPKS